MADKTSFDESMFEDVPETNKIRPGATPAKPSFDESMFVDVDPFESADVRTGGIPFKREVNQRGFAERFSDAFKEGSTEGFTGRLIREGFRMSDYGIDTLRERYPGKSNEELRAIRDQAIVQTTRDIRKQAEIRDDLDPAWRDDRSILENITDARYIPKFAGYLAAGAPDPLNFVTGPAGKGAKVALGRMATQGSLSGLGDLGYQIAETIEGDGDLKVRDEVDPARAAVAALIGTSVQGGMELASALRGSKGKVEGNPFDNVRKPFRLQPDVEAGWLDVLRTGSEADILKYAADNGFATNATQAKNWAALTPEERASRAGTIYSDQRAGPGQRTVPRPQVPKRTIAEKRAQVDELTKDWAAAPNVKVYARVSDIKDPDLIADISALPADQRGTVMGATGKDGTVHLLGPALDDPDILAATLYHEALGHVGMTRQFEDGLDDMLTRIYENGSANFKAKVDQWREANPDAYPPGMDGKPDLARSIDEVLAETAERGEIPVGLLDPIKNQIKDMLRNSPVGKKLKYSDREIMTILGMAQRTVTQGTKPGTIGSFTAPTGTRFARVWHGTPAERFENVDEENPYGAFDDSKMGSGEGVQAFSWGHYVAEDRRIAEGRYRDGLSKQKGSSPETKIQGKPVFDWINENEPTVDILDNTIPPLPGKSKPGRKAAQLAGRPLYKKEPFLTDREKEDIAFGAIDGTLDKATSSFYRAEAERLKTKRDMYDADESPADYDYFDEQRRINLAKADFVDKILEIGIERKRPGSTFEVELPDDATWLEWDIRPNDKVIAALRKLGVTSVDENNVSRFQKDFDDAKEALDTYTKSLEAKYKDEIVKQKSIYRAEKASVDIRIKELQDEIDALEDVDIPSEQAYLGDLERELEELLIDRAEINAEINDFDIDPFSSYLNKIRVTGEESANLSVLDAAVSSAMHRLNVVNLGDVDTGEFYYRELAEILGSEKAASKALAKEGIAGTKFADGNTRGGDLTNAKFNYVIYDPKTAKIVNRFARRKPDPDGERIGNINTKYITSAKGLEDLLDTLARGQGKSTKTETEIVADANAMGLDPRKVLKQKDIPDLAARITATRQVFAKTLDEMGELDQKLDAEGYSQGLASEMMQKVALLSALHGKLSNDITQTARALRAMQIVVGPNKSVMDAMAELGDAGLMTFNPNDPEAFARFMRQFKIARQTGGAKAQSKMAATVFKPGAEDYFFSLWYNALLSSPATHFANFAGTGGNFAMDLLEHGAAAVLGQRRRWSKNADRVMAREFVARLYGAVAAVTQANTWTNTAKSFVSGTTGGQTNAKAPTNLVFGFGKQMSDDPNAPVTASDAFTDPKNLPSNILEGPTRLLASQDEWWRNVIQLSNLYGLAVREASKKQFSGNVLQRQKALKKEVDYLVQNPTEDMLNKTKDATKVIQFLDEPSAFAKILIQATKLQKGENILFRGFHSALKMAIPFIRTPDAIIRTAIRRLGPLGALERENVKAFKQGGAEADVAKARMLIGSAMAAYIAIQAYNGNITGEGPTDRRKRAEWEATHQPNSIKIGDEWVSIQGLEPVSTNVSVIATIAERMKQSEEVQNETEENDIFGDAAAVTVNLTKALASNAYTENFVNFVSIFQQEDRGNAFENWAAGLASTVTTPAIVRSYNQVFEDNAVRDTTGDGSFGDRMMGRVMAGQPGLSQELPQRMDVYGRGKVQGEAVGGMLTRMRQRDVEQDPVVLEIDKLAQGMKGALMTEVGAEIDGRRLSAEERQEYQELSGQWTVEEVRKVMETSEWETMSKAEKRKEIKSINKRVRKAAKELLFSNEFEEVDPNES